MTDTNGSASSQGKFPEIVLDTTLAELLAEEPDYQIQESICNIKPCANPRHKTVPLNRKYLITSTATTDSNALAHLQLENVSYLLSFWAGHIEVPLIACEGWTDENTLTRDSIHKNARKGFSIINEKQRPWPKVFSNKDHFIQHHGTSRNRVRWAFAVDFAERMPSFVHPEVHYELNSKRWLAESPLRSANDRILDPECKCPSHTTHGGLWYYGTDCYECKRAVDEELGRLKRKLENIEPPFVLKLAQSLGSVGTMIVKNMEDRDKTIKQIVDIQRESLTCLTADNAHIYPVSLVVSDMLPGKTNALNFWVRGNGSIKFLGGCHQLGTRNSEGGIQHSALWWDQQEEIQKKFQASLDDIGKVLHNRRYFGPAGADIMETEDGTQYVIDLNVRTSTSTVLGCLKGHCEKRGFNVCGVYECILLSLSREEVEKEFQKEFEEGRFILLGNTAIKAGKKNVYAYPVVVAGEDEDSIKELGTRILKFKASVSQETEDAGGA